MYLLREVILMKFAKNLKYLRKQKSLSQEYIAEKLGYKSFTTIQKWESGIAEPSIDILKRIAIILGVTMDELINNDLTIDNQYKVVSTTPNIKTMTHTVPIYGRIPAGVPFEAIQERLGDVEIPSKIAKKKDLFALKIVGDSMDKVLPDGCIAVFQKVVEVNQGEIAAVMVNGDDAAVKHFTKSFTGCILEPDSHNPDHQMRFISKEDGIDVRVIGRLLWYCMDINGID